MYIEFEWPKSKKARIKKLEEEVEKLREAANLWGYGEEIPVSSAFLALCRKLGYRLNGGCELTKEKKDGV